MIPAGVLVDIAVAAIEIAELAIGRWRQGAAFRAAKLQAKIEYTDQWRAAAKLRPRAQRERRRRWATNMAVARAYAQTHGGRCDVLEGEVRRRVALAVQGLLDEARRRMPR